MYLTDNTFLHDTCAHTHYPTITQTDLVTPSDSSPAGRHPKHVGLLLPTSWTLSSSKTSLMPCTVHMWQIVAGGDGGSSSSGCSMVRVVVQPCTWLHPRVCNVVVNPHGLRRAENFMVGTLQWCLCCAVLSFCCCKSPQLHLVTACLLQECCCRSSCWLPSCQAWLLLAVRPLMQLLQGNPQGQQQGKSVPVYSHNYIWQSCRCKRGSCTRCL